MNIQSIFNEQCISSLPKIKKITKESAFFEANQIVCFTLRKAMDSKKAVSTMSDKEKKEFQEDLIETFKFNGWI